MLNEDTSSTACKLAVVISSFAQRNYYVYSQASRSKFILNIFIIYMSSSIYYDYTKGERSDAVE